MLSELAERIANVVTQSLAHPTTTSVFAGSTNQASELPKADDEQSSAARATRAGRTTPQKRSKGPDLIVAPTFKLVFLVVVSLTIVSGLLQVLLAQLWIETTENQQQVFEGLGFAWKAGIGAIFGLVGGKIT